MLLFEKIADMFEAIAHTLPLYRQIYEVCNRCTSDPHLKEDDLHLATLMSYVYFDTVLILLEIYRIFCRGAQGMLYTFFYVWTTRKLVHSPPKPKVHRISLVVLACEF